MCCPNQRFISARSLLFFIKLLEIIVAIFFHPALPIVWSLVKNRDEVVFFHIIQVELFM